MPDGLGASGGFGTVIGQKRLQIIPEGASHTCLVDGEDYRRGFDIAHQHPDILLDINQAPAEFKGIGQVNMIIVVGFEQADDVEQMAVEFPGSIENPGLVGYIKEVDRDLASQYVFQGGQGKISVK